MPLNQQKLQKRKMSGNNQTRRFPEPTRSRFEPDNSNGDPNNTEGLLAWDWVVERVRAAHNYWLGSTYPDGRPHTIPVWCVWYNGTLYFTAGRESQKFENLSANPQVVIHLESSAEPVIFEGRVEEIPTDPASFEPFANAYEAKYPGFRPEVTPNRIHYRLVPSTILAWTEEGAPENVTCWKYS